MPSKVGVPAAGLGRFIRFTTFKRRGNGIDHVATETADSVRLVMIVAKYPSIFIHLHSLGCDFGSKLWFPPLLLWEAHFRRGKKHLNAL